MRFNEGQSSMSLSELQKERIISIDDNDKNKMISVKIPFQRKVNFREKYTYTWRDSMYLWEIRGSGGFFPFFIQLVSIACWLAMRASAADVFASMNKWDASSTSASWKFKNTFQECCQTLSPFEDFFSPNSREKMIE